MGFLTIIQIPCHHVLTNEIACNILNFGPNNYRHTYRHVPIDYDDYRDVLFYIGSKTPLHMNDDLCCILCVIQLLLIYVYACLCWAWTLKHMIDDMFCVERGALENLSD